MDLFHLSFACLSSFSDNISVDSKRYHPGQPQGIWPKIMPGGPVFAHTNCPGSRDLTRAGKLQKFNQHTGLIPTQNRFFGMHTVYETEFSVYILDSFKMPFPIPYEISVSGDYSRLENFSGPWGFDQSNLTRGREFDQKFCLRGWDLTSFWKFALQLPRRGW